MKVIESNTPRSDEKRQFLRSLASDLRLIGIKARVVTGANTIKFTAHLPERGTNGVLQYMDIARDSQLKAEKSFIQRIQRGNITDLFINGSDLEIDNILPRIHICNSSRDFEILKYCRLLQSVPNANRIGRQISALIYDEGQRDPALMGAISLASSMYTLGCRDRYFGWAGNNAKLLKDTGLRHLMDLAICIALPPYSFLLGGKLMALLAMTDPFRIEFRRKYGASLLGLITTCATGLHCPIFNRIMIKKGGLYRRIGETAGYTTAFFTTHTIRAARVLTRSLNSNGNSQLSSKPIRILKQAIRLCGLPYEPLVRLGNQKAVYFAVLSEGSLISLKTGTNSKADSLTVMQAIDYWKTQILPKRRHNSHSIKEVESFRRESITIGAAQLLKDIRSRHGVPR